MSTMIADANLEREIIAQRQAAGSDRWDEVWEGVYILMPLPNIEHQGVVSQLTSILTVTVDWPGLGHVYPGVNVSDRIEEWAHNYRCQDVAVYLNETTAESLDTFWYGGPDLAIEVVSPNDRSREKLEFYAAVGTQELLLINREPWSLKLFRLEAGVLTLVGQSDVTTSNELASDVVPLAFSLEEAAARPQIRVQHRDEQQTWTV